MMRSHFGPALARGDFYWSFDMPKEDMIPEAPLDSFTPVMFRDRAFKARTLMFADGGTLAVEKGLVTALTQEHVDALDGHVDFKRAAEGT
jgi:hypothetical protein